MTENFISHQRTKLSFYSLITGKNQLYDKRLRLLLAYSGSHLLSHAVSSIVPSAALGLTYRASTDSVFGMGTGGAPERIATGIVKLLLPSWRFALRIRHRNRCSVHARSHSLSATLPVASRSLTRHMTSPLSSQLRVPARLLLPDWICRMDSFDTNLSLGQINSNAAPTCFP